MAYSSGGSYQTVNNFSQFQTQRRQEVTFLVFTCPAIKGVLEQNFVFTIAR